MHDNYKVHAFNESRVSDAEMSNTAVVNMQPVKLLWNVNDIKQVA